MGTYRNEGDDLTPVTWSELSHSERVVVVAIWVFIVCVAGLAGLGLGWIVTTLIDYLF